MWNFGYSPDKAHMEAKTTAWISKFCISLGDAADMVDMFAAGRATASGESLRLVTYILGVRMTRWKVHTP